MIQLSPQFCHAVLKLLCKWLDDCYLLMATWQVLLLLRLLRLRRPCARQLTSYAYTRRLRCRV